MSTAAILLAGGSGLRVGSTINKVYLEVGGQPLLSYPLVTMDRCEHVGKVVLVARPEDRVRAESLAARAHQTEVTIVDGGASRQESEWRGLEVLVDGGFECIAIHDGARPFLSLGLLGSVIEAACRYGGAIPTYTPDRAMLRKAGEQLEPLGGVQAVQTPQCFRAGPLVAAYRAAREEGFEGVDTAETVERFTDLTIAAVSGDSRAFKVTFEEDLVRAERIAAHWDLAT